MSEKLDFNNGSCILRINTLYSSLNPTERHIADYILQNPSRVLSMTIDEMAEATLSSYATVSRFCRKLEYSGFKEMRRNLLFVMRDKGVEDIIQSLDVRVGTSVNEVCGNIYALAYKVLDESLSFMDIAVVESVVDALLAARKVFFVGSGTSGICARYAYTRCMSIGINASYESDATFYRMIASLLEPDDLLFAISSSGRTASVVETARMCKKNRVTVVSLSDFAISPLSRISDYSLYTTPRNVSSFANVDMPLLMGQVTLLDLLYRCLCVKSAEAASVAYQKTRSSVDSEKMK